VSNPAELKYTNDHEWVRVEDGVATVGITNYAQDALGDVVFVDLPEVGAEVSAGDSVGEVESTKSVSDVYSPLSGEVVEVNEDLEDEDNLTAVNQDPYGRGWMFKIKLSDPAELDGLMDAEAYGEHVAAQDH
jgi:glycine cleavage system H protein